MVNHPNRSQQRYRQHAAGTVIDTTTDRMVGRVLTPQGVPGVNGPAFYRLDQLIGNPEVSQVPAPDQIQRGIVIRSSKAG